MPVEEGELLEKAVEKAAVQLSVETGSNQSAHLAAGEQPKWAEMQVDALVDVMRGYLSGTDTGNSSSDNVQSSSSADNHLVMIHVDENALVGRQPDSDNTSNLTNPDNATSQYPIETVRRLCCDGSIAPIIANAEGEPLDIGRRTRTITTAIRRALWSRDKGCAFPGCNHKRFVDAHHIKHWADGGETAVENLVLLCSSHHKLVHEGGFSIQRDQSGELFFRRPDGKALPHCGYRLDDWVDDSANDTTDEGMETDQKNSREFFPDLSWLENSVPDNSVSEQSGGYHLH